MFESCTNIMCCPRDIACDIDMHKMHLKLRAWHSLPKARDNASVLTAACMDFVCAMALYLKRYYLRNSHP